jgi:hypothetical protein
LKKKTKKYNQQITLRKIGSRWYLIDIRDIRQKTEIITLIPVQIQDPIKKCHLNAAFQELTVKTICNLTFDDQTSKVAWRHQVEMTKMTKYTRN